MDIRVFESVPPAHDLVQAALKRFKTPQEKLYFLEGLAELALHGMLSLGRAVADAETPNAVAATTAAGYAYELLKSVQTASPKDLQEGKTHAVQEPSTEAEVSRAGIPGEDEAKRAPGVGKGKRRGRPPGATSPKRLASSSGAGVDQASS